MNKWTLQIATAILGIVPIATGLIGMSGISDPIYASIGLPANPLLDSNLRFFGGVWFGLGLALYWLIPKVEKQTVLFRAIWGMIFAGGIGRLISMLLIGRRQSRSLGSRFLRLLAPRFSLHGKHA
jgi:hypothetical protein